MSFQYLLRIATRTWAGFNGKNAWVLSSHIAMSMMLALFPFVLFTVALGGAVTGALSENIDVQELVEPVFAAWPEGVATPIKREVYAVLAGSGTGLITLGGVLAIYFASNGVDAVRVGIVQAYGVEDPRPFWLRRLVCIALVLLGGFGILLVALVEVLLPLAANLAYALWPQALSVEAGVETGGLSWLKGWPNGLNGVIAKTFAAAVPVAAVLLYHLVLLPGRISLRSVLPGVLFTLVAWWALAFGFAIYISRFASYSATYAGLAGAMAALIFLYLNAAALLFGAELNGVLRSDDRKSARG